MHRIEEKDGLLHVWISAPGFKKDHFDISLKSERVRGVDIEVLHVKASNKDRVLGPTEVHYPVVLSAKAEDVSAAYEDGVLHLEILFEEPKAKKIKVS